MVAGDLGVGIADLLHRRAVGPQPVGDDLHRAPIIFHGFLHDFAAGLPEAEKSTRWVDFRRRRLWAVASSRCQRHSRDLPKLLGAALLDLAGKERTEPVPPEANRFVADIDAALMQQVLNIPQREREPDVHHRGKPDDLGRCLEVAEWIAHSQTLRREWERFKLSSPDRPFQTVNKPPVTPLLHGRVNKTGWKAKRDCTYEMLRYI